FKVVTSPTGLTLPITATLKPWTITSVFAVGLVNGTPQIQVLSAQVPGVPGLPGTGSDPHAVPSVNTLTAFNPWLITSILALLLVLAFATYGIKRGRKAR
ncbi:MAG: hypothetical protein M3Z24_13395, partial [Chloroflexota bacterium]|nr:hypothetical protein [Chloroflexota bacterium]